MYNFLFCPTFRHEFYRALKPYPRNLHQAKEAILSLQHNPLIGDAYPGFAQFHIRKLRIALNAYQLSKREGLRFIYLLVEPSHLLLPLHIYKKGAYKQEYDVAQRIKRNLQHIIQEQSEGQCHQNLEQEAHE